MDLHLRPARPGHGVQEASPYAANVYIAEAGIGGGTHGIGKVHRDLVGEDTGRYGHRRLLLTVMVSDLDLTPGPFPPGEGALRGDGPLSCRLVSLQRPL